MIVLLLFPHLTTFIVFFKTIRYVPSNGLTLQQKVKHCAAQVHHSSDSDCNFIGGSFSSAYCKNEVKNGLPSSILCTTSITTTSSSSSGKQFVSLFVLLSSPGTALAVPVGQIALARISRQYIQWD